MKTNNDTIKYALVYAGSSAVPVLVGMLVGGAIGAVAGLLFAPHSGELSRAKILYKAIELKDQSAEAIKKAQLQAKSEANELRNNAGGMVAEIKQRGKEIANEVLPS